LPFVHDRNKDVLLQESGSPGLYIMSSILNVNVGVLGHVDSGKTSLSKALSTVASTACFDKNPQSKERGITIDLGFSSFQVITYLKCNRVIKPG
jgi:translation initiation factor 2 gamma subunit (eIF-2gamma)